MSDPILSRERIAKLADNAAQRWIKACDGLDTAQWPAKPTSPFDEHLQPDACKAWRASFERSLLEHSNVEGTEASA